MLQGTSFKFCNCVCMNEKEHELLLEQVMAKLEHIDCMFDIAQESPLDDDFSSSVSTWSTT